MVVESRGHCRFMFCLHFLCDLNGSSCMIIWGYFYGSMILATLFTTSSFSALMLAFCQKRVFIDLQVVSVSVAMVAWECRAVIR